MKYPVTIYTAYIDDGDESVRLTRTSKSELLREVADTCRKGWHSRGIAWECLQDVLSETASYGFMTTPEAASLAAKYWPENRRPDSGPTKNKMEAPHIPENDEDVIALYFFADAEASNDPGYSIDFGEDEYEVDLQAPQRVHIPMNRGRFSVVNYGGTASTHGNPFDVEDPRRVVDRAVDDMLASFILTLTAKGFPVHLPEFEEARAEAVEAFANHHY